MKVIDAIARILRTEGAEFLSAYPTTPLIEAAALQLPDLVKRAVQGRLKSAAVKRF